MKIKLFLFVLLSFGINGCVFHQNDVDRGSVQEEKNDKLDADSLKKRKERFHMNYPKLKANMSMSEIRQMFGEPDKSMGFRPKKTPRTVASYGLKYIFRKTRSITTTQYIIFVFNKDKDLKQVKSKNLPHFNQLYFPRNKQPRGSILYYHPYQAQRFFQEKIEYPYQASDKRKRKLINSYRKLRLDMNIKQVLKIMGKPDLIQDNHSWEFKISGSEPAVLLTFEYYLSKKQRNLSSKEDGVLILFFEKFEWNFIKKSSVNVTIKKESDTK